MKTKKLLKELKVKCRGYEGKLNSLELEMQGYDHLDSLYEIEIIIDSHTTICIDCVQAREIEVLCGEVFNSDEVKK